MTAAAAPHEKGPTPCAAAALPACHVLFEDTTHGCWCSSSRSCCHWLASPHLLLAGLLSPRHGSVKRPLPRCGVEILDQELLQHVGEYPREPAADAIPPTGIPQTRVMNLVLQSTVTRTRLLPGFGRHRLDVLRESHALSNAFVHHAELLEEGRGSL